MRHVVQRFGFRITRGWATLIVAVGILVGTAFWIGPFRPLPPDLKLVALAADGQFRTEITIPDAWTDSTPPQPEVPARFPLVLAVHNSGARAVAPQRVALSVPARYRLANSKGEPLAGTASYGNPLVQYVFDISPGRIEPGQMPRVLTNLDTLWLEPVVPGYYCKLNTDSIPEFVPAPQQEPSVFGHAEIFYSFQARARDRQTGLLTLHLPTRLLARPATPEPPVFPATLTEPEVDRPVLGPLRRIGQRGSACGDPLESDLQLSNQLWETATGGRFFVVYHDSAPRKYLYDLNRDSIIELEIWDRDHNGKFEMSRPARYPIPEFLMPARAVIAAADSVAAVDSTGAVVATFVYPASLFSDTDAGPFRYWAAHPRAERDSAGAPPATRDSAERAPAPAPAGAAPPRRGPDVVPPPSTSGFQYPPALFRNTDAGPFRYWRAQPRDSTPAARPAAPPSAAPPPRSAPPVVPRTSGFQYPPALFRSTGAGPFRYWRAQQGLPQQQTTRPPVQPPRDTGPRLLGVPVDVPVRRDTVQRDTMFSQNHRGLTEPQRLNQPLTGTE